MHAPSSPSIGFPPPSPLAHTVKPCLMSTLIHTHQNTSCPTQGRNLNDVGCFFEGQQCLSPISPESSGTDRNEPRLNREDLASTNSPSSHIWQIPRFDVHTSRGPVYVCPTGAQGEPSPVDIRSTKPHVTVGKILLQILWRSD